MGELEQYLVPIRRYSANPCMDCCCPISQCPWLREEKPVPGWTAKKRTFVVGRYQGGDSERGGDGDAQWKRKFLM